MSERRGYGDAEAKRIIKRAAEIDAEQGRGLDALALREIAAEAGISSTAVDRALEEHESAAVASPVPWLQRHRTVVTTVAIVAGLLVLFAITRITVTPLPLP
jgi:hypothetical protein